MVETIHHAIDVAAPPEAVWRVFADLATWPRWFPRTRSARSDGGSPWHVGGIITVDMSFPVIGSLPLVLAVQEIDPASSVRWTGAAHGIDGDHGYRFEDKGKWTRVTSHEVLRARGLRGAGLRLVRGQIDDETHRSLDKLRQVVEGAATVGAGA